MPPNAKHLRIAVLICCNGFSPKFVLFTIGSLYDIIWWNMRKYNFYLSPPLSLLEEFHETSITFSDM